MPVEFGGPVFGAHYKVKYIPAENTEQAKLQGQVEELLKAYNNEFSAWLPDSALTKFNGLKANVTMPVSELWVELVTTAYEVHRDSEGAYDPTVGPWVRLWGFGPQKNPRVPTQKEIEQLRASIGLTKLHLDSHKMLMHKLVDGLELDVNSLAPGHAADLIGHLLETNNIHHYLIDVGGELLAKGKRADGSAWTVGIEGPNKDYAVSVVASVPLHDESIATSGSYRQFKEINGKRISHTLDPRTGGQLNHHVVSVTVIAKSAILADAWATALMVLGESAVERYSMPIYMLLAQDNGQVKVVMNQSMQKRLAAKE